jgi:hypothetical protein
LAAYDHFHQDYLGRKFYLYDPIELNVTIETSRTFGAEMGKFKSNLDGLVPHRPLYFDVKCLQDVTGNLLEGIFKDTYQLFPKYHLMIETEYELHMSYDEFQKKRPLLLQELKNGLIPDEQTHALRSNVIEGLNYKIKWGPGVLSVTRSYHPFSHALNFHKTIFNYADKFVKDESFVVVLVTFPWYNQILNQSMGGNEDFYRATARRIFCQYKNDTTPLKKILPRFNGTEMIYEVSKHLAGIVFMEDNTILSKEPDKTNVDSFIYLNPNARNPIAGGVADSFLMGLHNKEYDNFEFDNY